MINLSYEINISGIPKIYDLILDHEHLILIEDYIHGNTLEQMLNNLTTIPETTACKIILKLCAILKHLHKQSPPIIHRDLKLSNVVLSNGHFHVLENFGRCVLHLLDIFFAFIVVLPLRSQKLEKRYP
nr:protein kinase [uncultured Anaerostipes sp.]